MRLRRRMGLPFALVDRYDPKQVFQGIGWIMKAHKFFFIGLKCNHDVRQNPTFDHHFRGKIAQKATKIGF